MTRWLAHPALTVLPWLILIISALAASDRSYYVAEWQQNLLIAGLIIASLCFVVSIAKYRQHRAQPLRFAWTGLLVQMLPLYLLVAVDAKSMTLSGPINPIDDAHALRRVLALDEREARRNSPAEPQPEAVPLSEEDQRRAALFGTTEQSYDAVPLSNDQADALGLGDEAVVSATADAPLHDLVEINQGLWRRLGGRATVIGRIANVSAADLADVHQRLPGLPSDQQPVAALYRFVMTCCAADATPITVLLSGNADRSFPVDTWVEVTGQVVPVRGQVPSVINVERMAEIEYPSRPYIVMEPFGEPDH